MIINKNLSFPCTASLFQLTGLLTFKSTKLGKTTTIKKSSSEENDNFFDQKYETGIL